jgi:hypothetical protein
MIKTSQYWGAVILTFSGSVFVLSGLILIPRQNVEVKNVNGKKSMDKTLK